MDASVTDLRRFWFPLRGYLGVGVTARTFEEARTLAEEVRRRYWPAAPAFGPVVEDIDVSTLDQRHVIPNMRPTVWPGVWFPLT